MKLEHWLLSTIIKGVSICINFVQSEFSHYHCVVVFSTVLIYLSLPTFFLRQRRTHQTEKYRSAFITNLSSVSVAIAVGLISFVYFLLCRNDDRLVLFSGRINLINSHYEQQNNEDRTTLHPSREIPLHGLEYIRGRWTIQSVEDASREVLRFRGVNLPAKTPSVPSNLRTTNNSQHLYESKRDVSFVGRPFSLEDAPRHFRRLSHDWGFNLIRLSTSWEAVMHEGPGILDEAYLAYLKELVSLAGEYGLYVIVDPHQDVWSRFTGGDGMPWWTLDAAGFETDESTLHDVGSAVLHQHWNTTYGDMPKMTWTNNLWKLATATMFTLFFAGDVYAPGITVEVGQDGKRKSVPIQQFLQKNYLQFMDSVAAVLSDCTNVIGFGTMNEPSNGFVGVNNIDEIHAPILHGHTLSAFDSMRLASGESLEVSYYPFHFLQDSHHVLNPGGKSAYKSPEMDIWRRVGIYKIDEETNKRILLRPNHFAMKSSEHFTTTYMIPFYESIQRTITQRNPHLVTYAEPHIDPADPYPSAPKEINKNSNDFGWGPHWYDFVTLFLGRYIQWISFDFEWKIPVISPMAIDWSFRRNLLKMKHGTEQQSIHILVGETGVQYSGSEKDYTLSLDRTLRAMENSDLDYAIWCYESINNDVDGDLWNNENLSLLSEGRGRGLAAAIRPYPYQYSSGLQVESQKFDPINETYMLVIMDGINCKDCVSTTLIFIPGCHFRDPKFTVSSGSVVYDHSSQNLKWQIQGRSMGFYRLDISEALQ